MKHLKLIKEDNCERGRSENGSKQGCEVERYICVAVQTDAERMAKKKTEKFSQGSEAIRSKAMARQ